MTGAPAEHIAGPPAGPAMARRSGAAVGDWGSTSLVSIGAVNGLGARELQRSARRWLARLHEELGGAGLAAAAAVPGLCAALDQHAAAVRDATTIGMEGSAAVAAAVLLAAYGRGVWSQARRHGWQPPPPHPQWWVNADWTSLRLAAVCALAQQPPRPRPEAGSALRRD